jgi:DnaJ-domain-containing protein 1
MTPKRIKLKDKSPEFAENSKKSKAGVRLCDMPGCQNPGEHRAPKDRGLQDYYHFCFQHAQEYNKAWDFFQGMSQADIEASIRNAMFGDRPTWIYTTAPDWEDTLRARAQNYRDFTDKEERKKERAREEQTPEREALLIMGLEPPITFSKIKERYRSLMKEHHPDLRPNDKESEEIVKRVNMSYTILKAAHEKYETLKK